MKFLYKYPQAEYPYRRLIEENQAARRAGARVRAARHRHLRRGPLLRHRHRIRQGRARRHRDPHRGVQSRPERGAAAHPAASVVPQHLGLGPVLEPPGRRSAAAPTAATVSAWSTDDTGVADAGDRSGRLSPRPRAPLTRPPGGTAPVHRQRDQRRARLWRRPPARAGRSSRTPFTATSSTASRASTRATVGTKAALHYRFDAVPPGGSAVLRLRLSDRATEQAPLGDVDEVIASAERPRPTSSTPRSIRRTASADERRVQRQALAGLLWTKQSYLFDVQRWLDGDDPGMPAAGSRGGRSATSTGGTSTRCA